MVEHVGAAATKVILRHPNQDMLNLMMKGLCGDGFTKFETVRFACITRKFTDGLSGFVTTPNGELLAFFRRIGVDKSVKCSLKKLLPCNVPSADAIFEAGADGILAANNNLRVRFTNAEDHTAGRLSREFIDAMHCNPTKIQALKDACNHSKDSSRALGNQNLNTHNPSHGKVTITCNRPFAHALQNQRGEYYRIFNTFGDCRVLLDVTEYKEFHIKGFTAKKRKYIYDQLAERRLAGTSMEFPPAKSNRGDRQYPAFSITPHPC